MENKIKEEIKKSPLVYKTETINEKPKEKWLGDLFHKGGLEASVDSTIKDRLGRVKVGIFESNAILEDLRMQVVGGILGTICLLYTSPSPRDS